MPRSRPERPADQGGIRPRYRRAFGCVTWVNMAMLVFLAAAALLLAPFWFIGDGEVFSATLSGLAGVGLILIVPGMAVGAILGIRTYRVENRVGLRAGAGIGATAGLASFLFFSLVGNLPLLAAPPALSLVLLIYALFAAGQSVARRRVAVLLAAGIALISALVALWSNFDPLALAGVLVSTAAAALGGFVGGFGYSRAGGDAMIPPGSRKIGSRE